MLNTLFLSSFEMATKDKKSQVRIDPAIAKALAIIAKADEMPGYELLEKICIDWIQKNKPDLMVMLQSVLKTAVLHPSHHTRHDLKAQRDNHEEDRDNR